MTNRNNWQDCQIDVDSSNHGILKQFFPDRQPMESDLHNAWSGMLAKLGEQGWELVSVFPNEGGRGRNPLSYVLKRSLVGVSSVAPAPPPPPPPPEDDDLPADFEPLRGP